MGLCRLAGCSRQAFYKGRQAKMARRVDEEAIVELVRVERQRQPRLGARKLLVMLSSVWREMDVGIGRDRFFRLLRGRGMLVERRRRGTRTTNSRHGFHRWPNRIRHIVPSAINQVWVSDLTYIRTRQGFMYLSLVMDAYSRKIVGYYANDTLEAQGCIRALRMALDGLAAGARPIHHSDRGMQYCCHEYVGMLEKRGCPISMTEINHCYENAKAERLNGILKDEYGLAESFRAKTVATTAVHQAVTLYNEFRPHTRLNYRTPQAVHAAA